MPNWVKNRLTITGPDIKEVIEKITSKDNENKLRLDFNKIRPMPESLKIISGSTTDFCVELYLTFLNPYIDYIGKENKDEIAFKKNRAIASIDKLFSKFEGNLTKEQIEKGVENLKEVDNFSFEDCLNYGKKAIDNVYNYGHMDWYYWCIENWGSKWNACETEIEDNVINFETAWSDIRNLILKLSVQFPENNFEYDWAEEQAGYYSGQAEYKDGKILKQKDFKERSKESFDKYFELWGGKESFNYNEETKTYDYIEDEEEQE